jgi:hypothetical protein
MRFSFLTFCMLTSGIFLFSNCSKDDNGPNSSDNYSPLTVGSNWTYKYSETGSSTDTFSVTVTNKDTTINNKTYKVLSSSDGSGNNYMAKIDSNYYRFASFAGIASFEELYLKDNRAVNSSWTSSVAFTLPSSPIPLTADLTYVIKEKGISYSVNGKGYNDVIHVGVSVTVFSASFGSGEFYYAKNVGMIESSISLTPTGQSPYSSTQQLLSYEIK